MAMAIINFVPNQSGKCKFNHYLILVNDFQALVFTIGYDYYLGWLLRELQLLPLNTVISIAIYGAISIIVHIIDLLIQITCTPI